MKHEEISMQTKRALAASLRRIMTRKSFSKITVSEIIADCGVNRKTFYYHFEDIYALLHWMLEQESVEILKHFINCAIDAIGRDYLSRFFYADFMGIADSVIRGMEEKYHHPLSDAYRSFLAEFYCEAISGMIVSWIRNRKGEDRAFAQESIITILRDSPRGVMQAETAVPENAN